MERLKRFHIIETDEEEDSPSNSYHSDNSNNLLLQSGKQDMWSVEKSRATASPFLSTRDCPDSLLSAPVLSSSSNHVCSFKNTHCHVEHVFEFVKIPEPTLYGHVPPRVMEPLLSKKFNIQK